MLAKYEKFAQPLLRIASSLVFLWFGIQQLLFPDSWVGFVPNFFIGIGFSAKFLVVCNAVLELTLGSFLIFGLYTRFASLILGLHLIGISLSIGISPTAIRDFGLAFATLSIFFNGADKWCLDEKFKKKE